MDRLAERYHLRPAAAFVRAHLEFEGDDEELVELGLADKLDGLHRFKRSAGLPRVSRVLGTLKSMVPEDLLDVGSGRGVFLWPLLEALPDLRITAVDRLQHRLEVMAAVRRGGLTRLHPLRQDVTALGFADGAFDVVTALEVLEHLPDPALAARELMRVARRFVVLSVPSKPDDNPQHLRVLDRASLEDLFTGAELRCEHVLGHLIAVAKIR